ncbi:MAG: ADP-ribosylation factor-like protein, partial [Thermoanaerobaculia bacterium]
MVLFNHSTRELTAKIVYYGPGLCGKTTNLRVLHERLEKGTAGRLLSLATAQDRTIYFDLLPVELGNIKGYTVRFQLCTVPGQVFYNETRKLVLRGVDGLVFVVDSQWSMLSHDLESFQNLKENLREADVSFESLPLVIQYNKRDLPGVLSVDALQEALGFQAYP